jgi:hypothetical protein
MGHCSGRIACGCRRPPDLVAGVVTRHPVGRMRAPAVSSPALPSLPRRAVEILPVEARPSCGRSPAAASFVVLPNDGHVGQVRPVLEERLPSGSPPLVSATE